MFLIKLIGGVLLFRFVRFGVYLRLYVVYIRNNTIAVNLENKAFN